MITYQPIKKEHKLSSRLVLIMLIYAKIYQHSVKIPIYSKHINDINVKSEFVELNSRRLLS